ncbi:hypothetical protein NEMIN01_2445, partial [Nematocida minor]|uniref:uncharacterized protein n=1 Tax=Nematocida minor TaxID=1912983 RepID=UPI00221F3C64
MKDSSSPDSLTQEFQTLLDSLGIEGDKRKALLVLPAQQKLHMINAQKKSVQTSGLDIAKQLKNIKKPFTTSYNITDIENCVREMGVLRLKFITLTEQEIEKAMDENILEELWGLISMLSPATWPTDFRMYMQIENSRQNKPIYKILEPTAKFFKTTLKSPAVIKRLQTNKNLFREIFSHYPSDYVFISTIILEIGVKCVDLQMDTIVEHLFQPKKKEDHLYCVPLCSTRIQNLMGEIYYNLTFNTLNEEYANMFLHLLTKFYQEVPLVGIMIDSLLRMCDVSKVLGKIEQMYPSTRDLVGAIIGRQESVRRLACEIDVRSIGIETEETRKDLDCIINVLSVLNRIKSNRIYDVLQYIRGCILEESAYKNKDTKKIEQEREIRKQKTEKEEYKCICKDILPRHHEMRSAVPSPSDISVATPKPLKTEECSSTNGEESAHKLMQDLSIQNKKAVESVFVHSEEGQLGKTEKTKEPVKKSAEPAPKEKSSEARSKSQMETDPLNTGEIIEQIIANTENITKSEIEKKEAVVDGRSRETKKTDSLSVHSFAVTGPPPAPPKVFPKTAGVEMPSRAPPSMPPKIPGAPPKAPPRMQSNISTPSMPPGIPPKIPGIPPRMQSNISTPSMPPRIPPGAPPRKEPIAPSTAGIGKDKIELAPIETNGPSKPGPRAQYIEEAGLLQPSNPQQIPYEVHIRKPGATGLWSQLDKSDLKMFKKEDFAVFERKKAEKSAEDSKPVLEGVIDKKRCKAIDIVLARVKTTHEKLIKAVDDLNAEPFSETLLSGLLKSYPTDEELEMVQKHDVELAPEKFYKRAMQVEGFKDKLTILHLKLTLPNIKNSLLPNIQKAIEGCEIVLRTKEVHQILRMSLAVVNILNSSNRNQGAWGIKLESLPRILENKVIVSLIQEKMKEQKINIEKEVGVMKEVIKISTDIIETDCAENQMKKQFIDNLDLTSAQKKSVEEVVSVLNALQKVYTQWKSALNELGMFLAEKEFTGQSLQTLLKYI